MKEENKPWVATTRRESGLIEHVCKHGVGHPAHGSVHWMSLHGIESMSVHGCDGCCSDPKWIETDLRDGVEICNRRLFDAMARIRALENRLAEVVCHTST